jgi:hypothetical protein
MFDVAMVDPPPVYLARTTLGDITSTARQTIDIHNGDVEQFRAFIAASTQRIGSAADVKYASVVLLGFRASPELAELMYAALCLQDCDIVGVMRGADDFCSAVLRRTKPRCRFTLPQPLLAVISDVHTLRMQGKTCDQALTATYSVLQAWGQSCGKFSVNFRLTDVQVWCKEDILAGWAALSSESIMLDILGCEERSSPALRRAHSARDLYVRVMGRKLAAHLKDIRETSPSPSIKYIDGDSVGDVPILLSDCQHLDEVICRTFNVQTGAMVTFPLMDWLRLGKWKSMTLVLYGDAGVGKTPVSIALLSEVTAVLQASSPWRPFFLKVGTVEALRDAATSGHVKERVPMLFDDLNLDLACGFRGGMPLASMKLLCEVEQTSSLQARYKDFNFSTQQPRIFTSNAMSPQGWHPGLPHDPWSCSDEARYRMDAHIKAVFKRTCFAHVGRNLVSQAVRDTYHDAREAS